MRFGPNLILYEDGEFFLVSNGGFYMPKNDWEEIKKVMEEFYSDKSEKDIEEMNQKLSEDKRAAYEEELKLERNKPKKKNKKPGCVYFIGSEEVGIKIGYSTNLSGRLKTLNVASPYELKVIDTIHCSNYEDVEKWAHEHFSDKRMNSEWFDITSEEIKIWKAWLING